MRNLIVVLFDILNLGLLVFLWKLTFKNYKSLPEKIAIHFDVEGKADNFGNKKFAFLIPIFGLISYASFFILNFYMIPENHSVEVSENNQNISHIIITFFMNWLLCLVLLIFLNSQDYMIRYSFDENAKVRVPFSAMLFSIIGSLIVFFIIIAQFK